MKKLKIGTVLLCLLLCVTALWACKETEVTITYYDGDSVYKTQTFKIGDTVTFPEEPQKDQFDFGGWYLDQEFNQAVKDPSVFEANVSLYARWVPIPNYTVSFRDYDGRLIESDLVPRGESATPPADPERTGYRFKGWKGDFTNVTMPLSITAEYRMIVTVSTEKSITYGDAVPQFPAVYTSIDPNQFDEEHLIGNAQFQTAYMPGSDAGEYAVTITGITSETYAIAFAESTLTVVPAEITVTVDSATKVYGQDNPAFRTSVAPDWLFEKDAVTFAATTTAGKLSDVGEYPIKITPQSLKNYTVTYEDTDSKLTISKAALTVRADNKEKIYGAPNPALTLTIRDADQNEVTVPELIADTTVTQTTGVGEAYAIVLRDGGAELKNYTYTFEPGVFRVRPALLTVTAPQLGNVLYGDPLDLTPTVSGLMEWDQDIIFETTVDSNLAGAHAIVITQKPLANYAVSYIDGSVTVTPRELVLSIPSDQRQKSFNGEIWSNSIWDGFVTGLQYSDVLEGTLETTDELPRTYRAAGAALGEDFRWNPEDAMRIVAGSVQVTDSYTIVYDLELTIQVGIITFTAVGYDREYDFDSHSISVTNVIAGDETAVVEYKIGQGGTYDFENPAFTEAGVYDVYFRITAPNHTTVEGEFRTVNIAKATLTVSADPQATTFNAAAPALTATVTGRKGQDPFIPVYTVTTTYNVGDELGEYPIQVSGETTSNNYIIVYEDAVLTVGKASYASAPQHPAFETEYTGGNLGTYALDTHYRWEDGAQAVDSIGSKTFAALYNADSAHYFDFETTITFTVKKAQVTIDTSGVSMRLTIGAAITSGLQAKILRDGAEIEGVYALPNAAYNFTYGQTQYLTYVLSSDLYEAQSASVVTKLTTVGFGSRLGSTDSYRLNAALPTYTIEDALAISQDGDVMIVTADTEFAKGEAKAAYTDNTYYTLKEGVTLLIPYTMSGSYYSVSQKTFKASGMPGDGGKTQSYVRLMTDEAVSLNLFIYGTLNVNAILTREYNYEVGKEGQEGFFQLGFVNHGVVAGFCGELRLKNTTVHVEDGGSILCNGYINGVNSRIIAKPGAYVQDVFHIQDGRKLLWMANTVAYGSVFPVNQYTIQNIEVDVEIQAGASFDARFVIVPSKSSLEVTNTLVNIIGPTEDYLYQLLNGYILKSYQIANGRLTMDIFGDMTMNHLSVEVKTVPIPIDTKNKYFPIPGNFSFNIKNGFTFEAGINLKLMPGVRFTVDEGAALVVPEGRSMVLYDENQYVDANVFTNGSWTGTMEKPTRDGDGGNNGYPVLRNWNAFRYLKLPELFKGYHSGTDGYQRMDPAHLFLNGSLTANGTFAGPIETIGANAVLNLLGATQTSFKEVGDGEARNFVTINAEFTYPLAEHDFHTITITDEESSVYAYFSQTETLSLQQLEVALSRMQKRGYEMRVYTDPLYTNEVAVDAVFANDTTLYIRYLQDITVHFAEDDIRTVTQILGQAYALPADTGVYGYFTSPTGGILITDQMLYEGKYKTLYAALDTDLRTVTFVTNGGIEKSPVDFVIGTALDTAALGIEPTKEADMFLGWYVDPELTEAFTEGHILEGDLVLYAKWQNA